MKRSKATQAATMRGKVAGVSILTQITPVVVQDREQRIESGDLLNHGVSTIIKNDINVWISFTKRFPKIWVSLIANPNFEAVLLQSLAVLIDIYTNDSCFGAKVTSPHVDTAAILNANFKKSDLHSTETRKGAMVDLKIIYPFVYDAATVSNEILQQRISSRFICRG